MQNVNIVKVLIVAFIVVIAGYVVDRFILDITFTNNATAIIHKVMYLFGGAVVSITVANK